MLPAGGRQHRGCIIPQTVKHSVVLLKMGGINARNMLSWLELLINRYCCIYLVFISFTLYKIKLQTFVQRFWFSVPRSYFDSSVISFSLLSFLDVPWFPSFLPFFYLFGSVAIIFAFHCFVMPFKHSAAELLLMSSSIKFSNLKLIFKK